MQAKKLVYLDATTEKERFHEARKDMQDNMMAEGKARLDKLHIGKGVPNITRQVLETIFLVTIVDLLETLP